MIKKGVALIFSLYVHMNFSHAQVRRDYQCAASAFYNYVEDIHRSNVYFRQGVVITFKSDDSLVTYKWGLINANQWNRNTFQKKLGYSIESGAGIGFVREKKINHITRQTFGSLLYFFKFYNNEMLDRKFKGTHFFPGIELGESMLFPIKSGHIGPFLQFSCHYGNMAYQDFFHNSYGMRNNNNKYFHFNMKLGLNMRLCTRL